MQAKSPEANQEILESFYAVNDILGERVKIFDNLEEQFDKSGLELPKNAEKLISDKLTPYVNNKLKELSATRKELKKGKIKSNSALQMRRATRLSQDNPPPPGSVWVLAPTGKVVAVPLDQLKAATSKESGGRIVE